MHKYLSDDLKISKGLVIKVKGKRIRVIQSVVRYKVYCNVNEVNQDIKVID